MIHQSILWRRLDHPGHDAALLTESSAGIVLEGSAVFEEAGPFRLDYVVMCDTRWRTRAARITGWMDKKRVDLDVVADQDRQWSMNGVSCPRVSGCDDIDLSFSPATNMLPIRRARLSVGEKLVVCAAWLRIPELVLEPLPQTYERLAEHAYCYSSHGGAFAAVLGVDAVGFVTTYPGLWQRED